MERALEVRLSRILYVVASGSFFASHRLALATAAKARGFDVQVIAPEDDGAATIRSAGLRLVPLEFDRGGVNPLRDAFLLWKLLKLYRSLRPAIVHHVTIKPVLYGTIAARLAGVPRVVNAISGLGYMFSDPGSIRYSFGKLLYRVAFPHPRMTVIVQNPEDRAFFLRHRLADARDLVLIPGSGVNLEQFRVTSATNSRPIVVQTSRMLAEKGVREFVAAARQLRRTHSDARFVLVGAPDARNPSAIPEAELAALNAEGVVEWWGHRTDIPEILSQCAIYCLPSRYREGLPKSLIEGAAAALPLVTTDVPGCRDAVRPGETGFLVPPGNVEALVDAIDRLLSDRTLRVRMGLAARADAEARFSVERIVEAQLAIYGSPEAADQGRAGPPAARSPSP
ncbi:MAG: glycosyltransferase family 4 protein [Sphingomonadaceae bacterium]